MAFDNFGELKTSIGNWLKRSDLSERIPDFVELCEADMRARLRPVDLQARTTVTVDAEYVDIPAGLKSVTRMSIDGDNNVPMRFVTPEVIEDQYPSDATGQPLVFTIIGNQFQFRPVPSTSFTANLAYQAALTSLSADSDTNYVLTNHPDTYLNGALKNAFDYLNDDLKLAKYAALYEQCVQRIKDESGNKRVGSNLRIRPQTFA